MKNRILKTGVVVLLCAVAQSYADDDKGFELLFNGKNFEGWQDRNGKAPGKGWVVKDGAMVRAERAGDIWTKERFANFILDLEFKTTGNSGVFIRTDNPKDNVQTGIEIQIDNPPSGKPGKHSVGAIYDLVAPTKNVAKRNDWNRLVITCIDNRIKVAMNGTEIVDMDLDKWTTPRMNPDGSKNKFRTALKDFKREGHIGFQDHGAVVMYRNIKIKRLK
ncbi:MAG: glycosyl hydrolase [Gemmatales bacterium]|nr:MAG: glycosyl hydrolase [Gemmatales bacterium]